MSKEKTSFGVRVKKGTMNFLRWLGVVLISGGFRLVWWPKISYENAAAKKSAKNKQAIIICNHCYWFDPLMMYVIGGTGKLSVVAAKEVLTGFKGKLLRILGCISVDRTTMDLVCLRECAKRVREGEKVAIFPEGQINFTDKMLEFKAGVSLIAAQTGAPVIPVYISGDYRPFGHVRLLIGEGVDLTEEFSKVPTAAEISKATELLYDKMTDLSNQLYASMTERELQGVKNFREKFTDNRENFLEEEQAEAQV